MKSARHWHNQYDKLFTRFINDSMAHSDEMLRMLDLQNRRMEYYVERDRARIELIRQAELMIKEIEDSNLEFDMSVIGRVHMVTDGRLFLLKKAVAAFKEAAAAKRT